MAEEKEKTVKRRGRPPKTMEQKLAQLPKGGNGRGRKSPVIGDNGLQVEASDNSKFLSLNMELVNLPDIDLHDPEQVQARLNEYFALYSKYDMKPTVAGMAMSLNGMSRRTLYGIVNDTYTGSDPYLTALPRQISLVIKKNYHIMENLWETYMNSGKVNPVSGIFLGKNNYGYQDKQEISVAPTQPQEEYSVEDIKKRYLNVADVKEVDSDDNNQSD